jgi:general transcription factor 3C polypeptide 5 (transcription factor C subunit 1)
MAPSNDNFPTTIPHPVSSNHASFLINFPGYINSEKRALATFGGINGLCNQLQLDSSSLQLKLRPEDPYSHPIIADRVLKNSIVVQLSRPKVNNHSNNDNTSYTCTVIATPSIAYNFTSPVDMQFLPSIGHRFRRDAAATATGTGGAEATEGGGGGGGGKETADGMKKEPIGIPAEPLLCLPAVFLEQSTYDYAFQDDDSLPLSKARTTADGTNTAAEQHQQQGRADGGRGYTIGFLDPSVPPPIQLQPEQQRLSHLTSQVQICLYDKLTKALLHRPIWLPALLFDHLGEEAQSSPIVMRDLLALLCYKFRNGPWRGAWIRKGYDPRLAGNAEEALGYQVLRYQLPIEWMKFKAAMALNKKSGGTENNSNAVGYNAVVKFRAVPQAQNTTMQLQDIQDDSIKSVLYKTQRIGSNSADGVSSSSNVCSDTTGWLTTAGWEEVRKRVRERYQELMKLEQREVGQQEQQQQGEGEGGGGDVDVAMNADIDMPGVASIQGFMKEIKMNRGLLAGESSDDDDFEVEEG